MGRAAADEPGEDGRDARSNARLPATARAIALARKHRWWLTILAVAAGVALYFLLRPSHPDYEYVARAADRGEVVRRIRASGKLRALNTIKVGAEVSGQITKVYVDFNSPVQAGQVLAEIDPTRLRAAVQQANAHVLAAESQLAQARASATKAHGDVAIEEREFTRRKYLAGRGFVSGSSLDAAENALVAARSAIRTSTAQESSARAQIAQSRAELSSALLELKRATIVAPVSGVVINKLVEPGTTVTANFQTPNLFEIAADTTRMQVEASVDEADIGEVRQGQEVKFTVDSYPGESFHAVVRQVRKAASEAQNVVSYLVILAVDNREGKLLPGMTANVEIITARRSNVLRVPTVALGFRPRPADRPPGKQGPGTFVYVSTHSPYRPERRAIRVGLEGEEYTEVVKGLAEGEKVITRTKSLSHKPDEGDEAGSEQADEGDGR